MVLTSGTVNGDFKVDYINQQNVDAAVKNAVYKNLQPGSLPSGVQNPQTVGGQLVVDNLTGSSSINSHVINSLNSFSSSSLE
jgi:hypothetical protein